MSIPSGRGYEARLRAAAPVRPLTPEEELAMRRAMLSAGNPLQQLLGQQQNAVFAAPPGAPPPLPVADAAPVAPAPIAPPPVIDPNSGVTAGAPVAGYQDEMSQILAAGGQPPPAATSPHVPASTQQAQPVQQAPSPQAPAPVNVNVSAGTPSEAYDAQQRGNANPTAPTPAMTGPNMLSSTGAGGGVFDQFATMGTQNDLFDLLADDPASAFYRALGGNPQAALAMDRNFMTKRAVGRYDDAIEPLSLIMSIMSGQPVNPVDVASQLLGRNGRRLDIGAVANNVLQGALSGGNAMAGEALSQLGMNNVMALLGLAQQQQGMLPGYVQARQNIAARELMGLRNQQYDRGPSLEDDTMEWARVVARLAGV